MKCNKCILTWWIQSFVRLFVTTQSKNSTRHKVLFEMTFVWVGIVKIWKVSRTTTTNVWWYQVFSFQCATSVCIYITLSLMVNNNSFLISLQKANHNLLSVNWTELIYAWLELCFWLVHRPCFRKSEHCNFFSKRKHYKNQKKTCLKNVPSAMSVPRQKSSGYETKRSPWDPTGR